MMSLEEYTWAFRIVSTRCFGKFVPFITMFPVGELLNHHNVETFYIYQMPGEIPDASNRYSGVQDLQDRDDDLVTNDKILETSMKAILDIVKQFKKIDEKDEKFKNLMKMAGSFDERENLKKNEFEIVKPDDLDLEEHEDKIISICTGPDEHYLPGSEVYMSYGRYSNRQLLSSYGFCLSDNKYNYYRLKLNLKDLILDPVLKDSIPSDSPYLVFKLKSESFCEDLLSKLRSLNWSPNHSCSNFFSTEDMNLETEILHHSIHLLQKELSSFSTTYEEDQEILSNPIPLRQYFAVQYRSLNKQVLSRNLSFLQSVLSVLPDRSQLLSLSASDQQGISHYLCSLPSN
jgi:hypothetical protein